MKIIENNLNKKWYDEFAEASPIFASLPAHAIGDKIISLKHQYKCVLNFYFQNKTHWLTLIEDQDLISEEILNNYLKNRKYYRPWFLKWKKKTKRFNSLFKKIKKTDLSLLSEKKLLRLHQKVWKSLIKTRKIDMLIDPFIFGSERRMIKELNKFCTSHNIRNVGRLYTLLTSPEKESLINKFELSLIKLTKRIRKKKIPRYLPDEPSQLSKLPAIKNHLDKYCWIKGNWGRSNEYTVSILINEIKELLSKNLSQLEQQKKKIFSLNKEKRKKILKKFKFNKIIKALSDLTVFFSFWHDLRKENALKYIYYESLFLKEFSKRFKLNFQDLHLFDISEIEKILKNRKKFNFEIKRRKKLFLTVHANNRIYLLFGSQVKKYLDKILGFETKKIDTIKGVSAFKGKVKGKVKIIHEYKDFYKFKKGDILVTGMTRPEFIAIAKKAKAIITNEGGITCHAAIISRELEIPCVVATRVATKILKDGDRVEVDANKGIIRKIR